MSRYQRQCDELRELCRSGSLAHAIDLAFGHFADFGRDDALLHMLTEAIGRSDVPDRVRRRFAELNQTV